MNDKKLKIFSLACALVGILGLAFVSLQNEYTGTRVYEISEKMLGKKVAVNGTVLSISSKENNVFMTVEDYGTIKVVAFNQQIFIKKGANVTVYGRVNIYKNELEIVAEKIISLPNTPTK